MVVGIGVSAVAYGDANPEPYSLTNHFISELGWAARSPKADWFNRGTMIFCGLGMPVVVLLGVQIRTWLGYAASLCGMGMLLSGIAVALLPMDDLRPHLQAAVAYFLSYFLTVTLFTVAMVVRKEGAPSRWIVPAGLLGMVVALTFLLYPKGSIREALRNLETFQRPDFWWLPILEWSVLISSFLWGAAATWSLWQPSGVRRAKAESATPAG